VIPSDLPPNPAARVTGATVYGPAHPDHGVVSVHVRVDLDRLTTQDVLDRVTDAVAELAAELDDAS
jgi:hypothetical protein